MFSSVEQYVIIIAASIPIIMPAFRWIGEKLSGSYRFVTASLTALRKKTETGDYGRSAQPEERSSERGSDPDIHSEEYILPAYALGSGKNLIAVTSRGMECDKD